MPGNRKILLIEDEAKIARMVKDYLEKEGFDLVVAENGNKGLELFLGQEFALVILDLLLPDINGLDICRALRQKSSIPIIMLTAKSQEVDRVVGLEMGADDYITKPFSLAELAARIRAVLRRAGGEKSSHEGLKKVFAGGRLLIDTEKYEVKKDGKNISLTPTEFKILALMAGNPGRVYSRLQLLEAALGETFSGYERSIDTHISNLRKKIEDDPASPLFIITVFGLGYKFNEQL